MTDPTLQEALHEARLNAIEDGLAEFVFNGGSEEDLNNSFFWPADKLPGWIEVGDEITASLDMKNKEERMLLLKKRQEEEAKNTERRKMLEELVN